MPSRKSGATKLSAPPDESVVGEALNAVWRIVNAICELVRRAKLVDNPPTTDDVAYFSGGQRGLMQWLFEAEGPIAAARPLFKTMAAVSYDNPTIWGQSGKNPIETIRAFGGQIVERLLSNLGVQDPPGDMPYLTPDNCGRVRAFIDALPLDELNLVYNAAERFGDLVEMQSSVHVDTFLGSPEVHTQVAKTDNERTRSALWAGPVSSESPLDMNGQARALAILVQHPEWSDKQIAKEAGVSRTSLYRWPTYVDARKAVRNQVASKVPKGSKDTQGNIEAWDS